MDSETHDVADLEPPVEFRGVWGPLSHEGWHSILSSISLDIIEKC